VLHVRKSKWACRTAVGICVLAAFATFAACGGDDDDDDAAATSSPSTSTDAQPASAEQCEANVELSVALNGVSNAEGADAVKAAYTDAGVDALLDKFATDPPPAIAKEVAAGVEAVRQIGQTGDTSAVTFDSSPIDEYFFENCDYATAEVTAKDYEFDGLPDEMDAGLASFKFTNAGKELHEIVIVRKNDGVTESFDELLALPEDQATTKVSFAAGTGAGPGDTAYANGKLDPGEYIAVCFIPQGTSTGDAPGSGPPHAMLGMKHEFSVS
jgi:hypothetical protein